jgi:SAM-dependent methyltransferase
MAAKGGSLPARYARWRASRLGRITDALARRGADVTGLDADPAMLVAAEARATAAGVGARFVLGRAEELPFPDETFDRVTASALLCLVADRARVVAEMARVLKPGGRLVLGDLGARSVWSLIRRAGTVRGGALAQRAFPHRWRAAPTRDRRRARAGRAARLRLLSAGRLDRRDDGAVRRLARTPHDPWGRLHRPGGEEARAGRSGAGRTLIAIKPPAATNGEKRGR